MVKRMKTEEREAAILRAERPPAFVTAVADDLPPTGGSGRAYWSAGLVRRAGRPLAETAASNDETPKPRD